MTKRLIGPIKFKISEYINNVSAVVSIDGINLIGSSRSKLYFLGFKGWLKFILYSLLYRTHIPKCSLSIDSPIVFYGQYVLKQESTADILDNFLRILDGNVEKIEISEKLSPFLFFNKVLMFVYYLWKLKDINGYRVRVAFAAAKGYFDVKDIKDAIAQVEGRNVVTFCDAIGAENLIAQCASDRGLMTFTLQHGQYRRLNEASFSQDIEAINNFVSNRMFCWGEATIVEFEMCGFPRERFIPIGRLMSFEQVQTSISCNEDAFGLAFSGENSKEDNFKLLSFANKMYLEDGVGYYIRFHPSNNFTDYEEFIGAGYLGEASKSLEYYRSVKFTLMAMTGFFIECLFYRHNFFVIDDDSIPDVYLKNLPLFSSSSSYDALVSFSIDFERISSFFNDSKDQKNKVLSAFF